MPLTGDLAMWGTPLDFGQPSQTTNPHQQARNSHFPAVESVYQNQSHILPPIFDRNSTFNEPRRSVAIDSEVMQQVRPRVVDTIDAFSRPNTALNDESITAKSRNISNTIDWERYQPHIKKFWLDENRPLDQTMRLMEEEFGFKASKKMYKTKFKEWHWKKNIDKASALWMLDKRQVRLAHSKGTQFKLGDEMLSLDQIQRSVSRSKAKAASLGPKTPPGVSYCTPAANAPSPFPTSPFSLALPHTDSGQATNSNAQYPRVTWEGHAKSYFDELNLDAQRMEILEQRDEAESKYHEAFSGLRRLLPPTHPDITKLAYRLARIHARNGNMRQANNIFDWMNREYVARFGSRDRRTMQHLMNVIEMLQSWSRAEDAVPLVHHLFSESNRQQEGIVTPTTPPGTTETADVEHRLTLGHIYAHCDTELAEAQLIQLIEHCEALPEAFPGQTLRAWTEVISIYDKVQDKPKLEDALDHSEQALRMVIAIETSAWSLDLCQSMVRLAQKFIEAKRHDFASETLRKVELKIGDAFGDHDERTIQILTEIGTQYQDAQIWDEARTYFEHAQAACAAAYGRKDYRTKKFEDAIECGHYDNFPLPRYCFGIDPEPMW